ncbi:hypothetical protein ONS96_001639 [Cadophora gregata f. sp. sojae]|nr:hypothetical protein ONS96_001639 [Cadophora gregata f. sp. sojae]
MKIADILCLGILGVICLSIFTISILPSAFHWLSIKRLRVAKHRNQETIIPQTRHQQQTPLGLTTNGQSSWSFVKERVVLKGLSNVLEARLRSGSSSSAIEVNLSIPKLHPRISSSATHFSEESELPPFKIERRFRQCYHSEEWAPGQFQDTYKPDFPILWEICGLEDFGMMTFEDVEAYEKELWDRGDNVEKYALQLFGLENVDYDAM